MKENFDSIFGSTSPQIISDLAVLLFMIDDCYCSAGRFDKESMAFDMLRRLRDAAAEYYNFI